MARYSQFVLKVPLNNVYNKTNAVTNYIYKCRYATIRNAAIQLVEIDLACRQYEQLKTRPHLRHYYHDFPTFFPRHCVIDIGLLV